MGGEELLIIPHLSLLYVFSCDLINCSQRGIYFVDVFDEVLGPGNVSW